MSGIGELSISITARTGKAVKNIQSFRKSVNRLPSSIAGASKGMLGLATAAAGLIGIGAIGNEIRKSFSNIDGLAKTSDKIGIATEKLSALRFAAEETGAGTATLDAGLERMTRRVSDAAIGSGAAVDALNELGISAASLNQMSPDEQFKTIADSLGGVALQSDKARLAFDLFGRDGVSLLNTLAIGKDGLDDYEAAAEKLGITVSRVDAAQIEKANDAFGRIGLVVEGLTNKIAIGLAPVIEGVSNSFTEWATSGEDSGVRITSSIRGIGTVVGVVRDGIDVWIRTFKSVRAYVSEFFAWMAGVAQKATQTISDLLNMIPGVESAPLEFTNAFADEMAAAAKRARSEADEAWRQPLPSEGINKFFDSVDKKVEASRKAFAEAAKEREKSKSMDMDSGIGKFLKGQAKGLGGLLAQFGAGVGSAVGDVAESVGDSLRAAKLDVERSTPGILDATSSEGFAALRANMHKASKPGASTVEEDKGSSVASGIGSMVSAAADAFGLVSGAVADTGRSIEAKGSLTGDFAKMVAGYMGGADGGAIGQRKDDDLRSKADVGKSGSQEKLLAAQKAETGATMKVIGAINKLADKFDPPQILSFGEA